MRYCPNCNHKAKKKDTICAHCGFNLEQNKNEVSPQKEEKKEEIVVAAKKPIYKRPVFWATATALILILLTTGIITGLYYYNNYKQKQDYEAKVKSIWVDVVAKSNSLDNTLKAVTSDADLPMLANELADFESVLAEIQSEAVNIDPPEENKEQFKDFLKALDDLSTYAIKAKILANKKPINISIANLTDLKTEAETADVSTNSFLTQTKFIDKKLPENIFTIYKIFKPLISEAKSSAAKKKAQHNITQAAVQKKSAQQTVISFMQARIDKNVTGMRRYFTEAAAKAFDADVEFEGDFDPVDFKIIKTDLKGTEYIITGVETDRSWQGSKFTNKWQFQVKLESGSWLIDHRKLTS